MKQYEVKAAALSDAAAVLKELSNLETDGVSELTIITPLRVGYVDQKDDPPMSVKLHADEVRNLYHLLRDYYESSAT